MQRVWSQACRISEDAGGGQQELIWIIGDMKDHVLTCLVKCTRDPRLLPQPKCQLCFQHPSLAFSLSGLFLLPASLSPIFVLTPALACSITGPTSEGRWSFSFQSHSHNVASVKPSAFISLYFFPPLQRVNTLSFWLISWPAEQKIRLIAFNDTFSTAS